ncbi:MAG TPA: hypothetical protein VFN48_01075, partial [Solirubrobacteraceae bacterium]|nr:hypothetical protein [Solirubrobacteraceae bacterium]
GVFAAGIALRVVFMVLYRPGFLGITDTGSYLAAARGGLFTNIYDPAGYPLFIRLLHAVTAHLAWLVLVQHALGVLNAALLYTTVRRLTGSARLAIIPAVVVLFDGYALWVEHTPITETLFTFLVVATLCLAVHAAASTGINPTGPADPADPADPAGPGGRRALLPVAGLGVLIGAAGLVRPVGLLLAPIVLVWLTLVADPGWGRRVVRGLVLIVPVLVILGVYVLAQRSAIGYTGLTQDSGRVFYARAAGFADCHDFTPPPGTRALCESTPPSERGSFNQYLTGYPDRPSARAAKLGRDISPAWRVFGPPPNGNAKLLAFGLTAIEHQPWAYLSHVASDVHYFWADHHRAFLSADATPVPGVQALVAGYEGTGVIASQGLGFLRWYGTWIEITGPVMILLLLIPLLGLLPGDARPRRAAVLLAAAGWLLPLGAVATASVDPRFILPAYGPLAAAGAIGLRRESRLGRWLRVRWERRARLQSAG